MPVGVRKRALIDYVAVVVLLLCVFGSSASDHGPPAFDIGDDSHGLVNLASGQGTPVSEETPALRRGSEGTGATAMASESSSSGRSSEDGRAYQQTLVLRQASIDG